MSLPVLIDTDPGIDDALAIALALRSPELQVLGITTVYGNVPVRRATRNARHLLERLGRRDIPSFPGAAVPLVRPLTVAAETHGEEGLGYARVPGDSGPEPAVEAPQMMVKLLAGAPEPVTVIALGPLTNLALALALDRPACLARIREVVWMGGSAGAPGNTTPVSEWNAWSDPEAAQAVFASGLPVRMVGLDATRAVLLPAPIVDRLGRHSDGEVRWWAEMWRFYVEFHRRSEQLQGCIMNDPLAVALLIQPGLARWASMYVEVECARGLTRGQTLCDRFGFTGQPPNAQVCLEAEGEAVLALTLDRVLGVSL